MQLNWHHFWYLTNAFLAAIDNKIFYLYFILFIFMLHISVFISILYSFCRKQLVTKNKSNVLEYSGLFTREQIFFFCSVPSLTFERENTIQLGLLPFYHIYAFIVYFMCGLSWGQTTVVIPGFDPKLFLETIQKYKVTWDFDLIQFGIFIYYDLCNDLWFALMIYDLFLWFGIIFMICFYDLWFVFIYYLFWWCGMRQIELFWSSGM